MPRIATCPGSSDDFSNDNLFEKIPIASWIEDWNPVLEFLRSSCRLDEQDFHDIPQDTIIASISKIRVCNVNPAGLSLFGARSSAEFSAEYATLFAPRSLQAIYEQLGAIIKGESAIEVETLRRTFGGDDRFLLLKAKVISNQFIMTMLDITPHKELRDSLYETNAKMTRILESISDGFFSLDHELKITYFNTAAEKLLRVTRDEVIGKNLFDIYPEAKNSVFEDSYLRALVENVSLSFESYFEPHGNWYNVRVYPFDAGISVYFQITNEQKRTEEALRKANEELEIRVAQRTAELVSLNKQLLNEITAREQMSKELSANERKFRAVFEHNFDGLLLTSPDDGRVLAANPAACKMFRCTERELQDLGKKRFADEHDPSLINLLESIKLYGSAQAELTYRRSDGTLFDAEVSGVMFHDCDGEIRSTFVIRDITSRKRAQEKLLESEERFRKIFEQGPIGMAIVGLDFRWTTLNSALCDMLGYTSEELQTMTFPDITHPDDLELDVTLAGRLVRSEIPFYKIEKRYIKKTGEIIWANLTGALIKDSTGTPLYYVAMVEDISERKRSEQLLRRWAQDLERSNRDLERFAYIASHDLQEPLRNVANCLQLLQLKFDKDLGPDADTYINYAVLSARKMKSLVEDLLEYSRITIRGKAIQETDSEKVLINTLQNLKFALDESGAVITHDQLPTLPADPTQLMQVFQNLILNAIKFRKNGIPEIHISAQQMGMEWLFSVRDNGIGIDEEFFEKIFVLFQQLDKSTYDGTGIGLAIVKKIIERHRGRVWVESEVGAGSTFYFTIPVESSNNDS